ncbi:MAG: phosphatase, partial [Hyphomicrobiales bacterium]|nr:phosphatase [Hyphomicrobiales bacterium]
MQAARVFVDFDGTISRQDTTDLLLEQFADPEWLDIESSWLRGEIGSRECMARQISLLRVTPAALAECLRDVEIDPAFSRFVKLCHDRGLSVTVLSDGLDIVVETVLRHAGIALPVLANCATATEADRWQLSFPHMRSNCASAAGNCKCAVLATRAPRAVLRADSIRVGDGRSDFCGATAAGAVFAKGKLIVHCRATRLRHIP